MTKVVRAEGVEAAKRELRAQLSAAWRPFPGTKKFLRDHFPEQWAEIAQCGMTFKQWKDRDDPRRRKLQPLSCHNQPYCIVCTKRKVARRTMAALQAFHRCTPAGQLPRFIHIVQTAPLTEDGQGWGMRASQNPQKFSKVVWQTLGDSYGPGLGAVLSYQDFGERGFAKRHPHIDLTLNGWRLNADLAEKTPNYELKGQGLAKWQARIVGRALSFSVDSHPNPGNLNIKFPIVGAPEYYRILRYQLRELVDFRKISYNRDKQIVYWHDYKQNRRQGFPVKTFLDGLQEYQQRLGPWTRDEDGSRQNLHFRYGHMADRAISKTERLVGGSTMPHGKRCPCSECGDWDRVFEEESSQLGQSGSQGTQDGVSWVLNG